jgi:hypothetical protein
MKSLEQLFERVALLTLEECKIFASLFGILVAF